MSISHEDIKNVYFVGAGGIGMSALERYFNSRGISVAGYDRTPTRLTETLQAEGIDIVFDDDDALIPERFRNPADTLVVFTPAVPESHRGLSWFRRNGFTVMKRSEVLGLITAPTKSICFSGTHGKTTTSSMAAHALAVEGTGSNAFLGGVLRNYGSNLLLSADSPFSVVEADEFDRSFHRLRRPDHIIIDDYAHHPREIEASIASVKALYPSKKLTVVFQPHLYSRTRDFAADFSRALSGADEVILVPLYPAREEPIPGGSEMLLPAITAPVKLMTTADELAGLLASRGFEVLEVLGAGNIDDRIPEIINALPK